LDAEIVAMTLPAQIARTRAELRSETLKPRARRRIALEDRLQWLVLEEIKCEIRARKKAE
jgi:hypothetical protein